MNKLLTNLLIVLLYCGILTSSAQNSRVLDSLKTASSQQVIDSTFVEDVNYLTMVLRRDGQFQEGLAINDWLLSLPNIQTSTRFKTRTLHHRSRLEISLGNYDDAISSAKKAISGYVNDKDSVNISAIDNIIGVCHYFKNDLDSTLYYYNKSYELKKQVTDDLESLAISEYNIGIVYEDLGQFDEAITAYNQASEYLKAYGESESFLSDVYLATANTYAQLGRYMKAQEYGQLSLTKAEESYGIDNPNTSFVYESLTGLYTKTNDFENALTYGKKALDNRKKYYGNNHRWTAQSNTDLGIVNTKLKNYVLAENYFDKAISISKTIGDKVDLAEAYTNKADLYSEQQKFSATNNFLNDARILYQEVFGLQHHFVAQTLYDIAENYYKQEKTKKALETLDQVYYSSNYMDGDIEFSNAPFVVLDALRLQFEIESNDDKRLQLIDEQLAVINHIKTFYTNQTTKLRFSSTISEVVEKAMDFCFQNYQNTNDFKYLNKGFQLNQLNKNAVLLEHQSEREFKATTIDSVSLAKERSLKKRLASIRQSLYYEEQAENPSEEFIDSLFQIRLQTAEELEQLLVSIKSEYPEYYAKQYEALTMAIENVQNLTPKDALVLDYMLGKETGYVFAIGKDSVNWKSLNDISELKSTINSFRSNLLKRESLDEDLMNLKDILIDESFSNAKHLIIIPSDELSYLPFEILPTTNSKYLFENVIISYRNTISQLKTNNQKSLNLKNWTGFSLADSNALNFTNQEVQSISELLGGNIYTNDNATTEAFWSSTVSSSVLHIATHGVIDNENPMYSQLEFSDGSITASQLYAESIDAQLVVLSACDTGFGTLEKGEGVMSLSRAFQYAGVDATVVSLWQVPDKQSQELMLSFYNYLKDGDDANTALVNAKKDYLNFASDDNLKHPFYWAGFVVVGNTISTIKSDATIIILASIIIVIMTLLVFFRKKAIKKSLQQN